MGPLAVALGVGLLLGLERERRMGEGPGRAAAGIRTFALTGLLGGLAMRVGGVTVVAVAGAFVGLAALAGYVRAKEGDAGLTTEVAMLVAFLLGALAQDDAQLAAGLGVAVTMLLASRSRLHRLARETLTEQEIHDGLLFAAAALIVLPLVPDEGMGPNDAFNPFTAWRLVVLVLAVNGLGYVALRAIGPRYGLSVSGLLGGFASSTATIATMGRRAAREPAVLHGAVAAGATSTVATVVFTAMVVGAADRDVVRELAVPLVLAGVAAAAYGGAFAVRAARRDGGGHVDPGRAFDLRLAAAVAAGISGLLVLASVLEEALGRSGVFLTASVGGLADAQSAAASAGALAHAGQVGPRDAAVAVLFALSANTVTKAAVAIGFGGWRYARAILPGLALVIAAAWAGTLV